MKQLTFPTARHSDPGTSHAAAASVGRGLEPLILGAFAEYGQMSDDVLVAWFGSTYHGPSIRTARSRLAKAGHLIDTGRRARSARDREVIVWALSPIEEQTCVASPVPGSARVADRLGDRSGDDGGPPDRRRAGVPDDPVGEAL